MKTIFNKENKTFLKTISILGLPLIAQDLVNTVVNLLDSFMVGRLGLDAINAVGFSNQLFFLYSLLIFGCCSGSSVLMGQYWGKEDIGSIKKVMGIGLMIGMIAGVFFSIVSFFFPRTFISFYTDNTYVLEQAEIYLKTVAFSYLITPITMTINFALRSIRKTKIPMITIIIALITNAILNYIFIFVFEWGVFGAALATTIARVTELVAQQIIIRKLKLAIVAKIKEYFSFDKTFLYYCLKITVPVILNEFMWALGTVLYQIAYKATGDEAQGAYQISMSIQNMFWIIGMAVGHSTGILIANELGAGNKEKAISYSRKALVTNICVAIFMGVLLVSTGRFFINFFDVSQNVKDLTYNLLIVISILMVFKMFNFTTLVGILRNGGDTKYCLYIEVGAVWLIGIPLAFIGSYVLKWPIYFIVLIVHTEELVKMILSGLRVLSNKWANTLTNG